MDAPVDPEEWLQVKLNGCWSAVFLGDILELPEEAPILQEGKEADASAAPKAGRLAVAAITQVEEERPTHTELYDSGATRHISPYHDNFITYWTLDPPLFLNMANGQQFPAMGMRSMVISVPNGDGQSELTLESVLHAPSVSFTLVLLRALDKLGYRIEIGGGHLEILSCTSKHPVRIAQTAQGLYHMSHERHSGYAVEVVSVMELHRCMGHIAPMSTHKLVQEGLITGITLDPNSPEEHCKACIYTRATRQPVLKQRISKQAKQFGEEIHTDMWGPAPVSTRRG